MFCFKQAFPLQASEKSATPSPPPPPLPTATTAPTHDPSQQRDEEAVAVRMKYWGASSISVNLATDFKDLTKLLMADFALSFKWY
jgi:hypothetical protein